MIWISALFVLASLEGSALAIELCAGSEAAGAACTPDQIECATSMDVEADCAHGTYCMDLFEPTTGCMNFCPLYYDYNKYHECWEQDALTGCWMPPVLAQLGNEKCGQCKEICPSELRCDGYSEFAQYCPMTDPETGCDLGGFCMEPDMAYDGSMCPTVNCPLSPRPNEKVCEDYDHMTGCFMGSHVLPMEDPQRGVCEGICPSEMDCMAQHENAVYCPQWDHEKNCERLGYCEYPFFDNEGNECPSTYCQYIDHDPETEFLCHDHDEMGCPLPPTVARYGHPEYGMCGDICPEVYKCHGYSEFAQYCPMMDPETGCDMGGHCMEPDMAYDGSMCPHVNCPMNFPNDEKVCQDFDPMTGCPMPPYSVQFADPFKGICEELCNYERECYHMHENAIYCPAYDPVTGCEMPGHCEEPAYDFNGNECPNVFCQDIPHDYETEFLCHDFDEMGCPMPPTIARYGDPAKGICEDICPEAYMCHGYDNAVYCPYYDHQTGCEMYGYCETPAHDFNGNECPNVYCQDIPYDYETEYICYEHDRDGCPMPPTIGSYGNPKVGICPVLCPSQTNCEGFSDFAVYCPNIDPITGCDMGGHCDEPIMDANGMPCPYVDCPMEFPADEKVCHDFDYMMGCPMPPYSVQYGNPYKGTCEEFCASETDCSQMGPNARYCPDTDPVTGCEMLGYCEVPQMDINGNECPTAVCTNIQPGDNEFVCMDYDRNGCPMEPYTMPMGNLECGECPGICHSQMSCSDYSEEAVYCPYYDYETMCDLGGHCEEPYESPEGSKCSPVCPVYSCPQGMQLCPMGDDPMGCPIGDQCYPEDMACPPMGSLNGK